MNIQQGIAYNKLKKLNAKRREYGSEFDRAAANHRDISGMYRRGKNTWCDYLLDRIAKVDAEIANWKKIRHGYEANHEP